MITIAFEGLDASGKETQTKLLATALEDKGYRVYLQTLPRYETEIGKLIKTSLKTGYYNKYVLHTLLEVDRMDFVDNLHALELIGNEVIIYDRFTLSNLVYGVAKGLPSSFLEELQRHIPSPDITIYLDITPEESYKRKHSNFSEEELDIHEKDISLLQKVYELYNEFLPVNTTKINATKSRTEIAIEINKIVINKLKG